MKNKPTISEIKKSILSKGRYLIEYEIDNFEPSYFNKLVLELPDCHVHEVRPLQKIWIKKGIETESVNPYLSELNEILANYSICRTKVFTQFLAKFHLKDIAGEFYKLRRKLQEIQEWPKGNFEDWNYWSHGGDIEFDNQITFEHFNINMSNIQDLKYWSIYNHIIKSRKETNLANFIKGESEKVSKMFDLLVLENKLLVIRTPFGAKQYELKY